MSCKHCEKMWTKEDYRTKNSVDRLDYDFEYKDGAFMLLCDDEYYSHSVNYCPWCGRKLEWQE